MVGIGLGGLKVGLGGIGVWWEGGGREVAIFWGGVGLTRGGGWEVEGFNLGTVVVEGEVTGGIVEGEELNWE